MDNHVWIKWGIVSIIVILISLIIPNPSLVYLSKATYLIANHQEKEMPLHIEKKNAKTLTDKELVYLTTEFMNKLVQEINDEYRVIHFDTKDELLDDFEEIMSRELAKQYVDFYFEEKDGALYIIPTETPPWFNEQKDYDMIQTGDTQVIVSQTNNSVFYGHYEIELELTFTDQWRMTNIIIH